MTHTNPSPPDKEQSLQLYKLAQHLERMPHPTIIEYIEPIQNTPQAHIAEPSDAY
jgi:hypothetical protein